MAAAAAAMPPVSSSPLADPIPCLQLLARKRTFDDWTAQHSGAILQSCKGKPGRSWYLYLEPRASAVIRARLRFNRASLGESLSRRAIVASPYCPHPPCRSGRIVESVEHALLHCPMLATERSRCRITLNRLLQRGLDSPLSLETLLGSVQPSKPEAKPRSADPSVAAGVRSSRSPPSSARIPLRSVARRVCLPGEESALQRIPATAAAVQSSSRRSDSLRVAVYQRRFCSSLDDSYVKSAVPMGACSNDGAHVLSLPSAVLSRVLSAAPPLPLLARSIPIRFFSRARRCCRRLSSFQAVFMLT
jgi:hypothetical protein